MSCRRTGGEDSGPSCSPRSVSGRRPRVIRHLTLSTFRDVPWNGPFYSKIGFRTLQPSEWTSGMRAIREDETQHGLRAEARLSMRRELELHPLSRRLQVRVARQTGRLDEFVTFYRDGLGLP